jgi:enoyl-CoA hydratase
MYFGLTGERCRASDALYAGIATHYVPASRFGELAEALWRADDVDECRGELCRRSRPRPLSQRQADIDRHFGRDSVEAILASLDADASEWAHKTAATLRSKSPTSLKVTFRQLREGRKLDFEACMRLEYRIVHRIFAAHDFYEGIRAVVIDKDQMPRWRPASLDEVSEDDVAAYFAPLEEELPV